MRGVITRIICTAADAYLLAYFIQLCEAPMHPVGAVGDNTQQRRLRRKSLSDDFYTHAEVPRYRCRCGVLSTTLHEDRKQAGNGVTSKVSKTF